MGVAWDRVDLVKSKTTLVMIHYTPKPDCQIKNLSDIYQTFYGSLEHGVFIEIGAFDGDTVSNTCFLADAGWKGYYFEPVPEYALACQMRHLKNDVRVFPCAVGDESKIIEISVGMMISTTRMDHVDQFNQMSWSQNHHRGDIRRVPCLDINQALDKLALAKCDLAVIDVEGLEPAIIQKWNFHLLKPDLFIIESRDCDDRFPLSIRQEYIEMLSLLSENGYKQIQHDGTNVILSCSTKVSDNPIGIDPVVVF